MILSRTWACSCGVETPCEREDQEIGAVYQCPACKQVFGCLYPQGGGRAWIRIDADQVAFHNLILTDENKSQP